MFSLVKKGLEYLTGGGDRAQNQRRPGNRPYGTGPVRTRGMRGRGGRPYYYRPYPPRLGETAVETLADPADPLKALAQVPVERLASLDPAHIAALQDLAKSYSDTLEMPTHDIAIRRTTAQTLLYQLAHFLKDTSVGDGGDAASGAPGAEAAEVSAGEGLRPRRYRHRDGLNDAFTTQLNYDVRPEQDDAVRASEGPGAAAGQAPMRRMPAVLAPSPPLRPRSPQPLVRPEWEAEAVDDMIIDLSDSDSEEQRVQREKQLARMEELRAKLRAKRMAAAQRQDGVPRRQGVSGGAEPGGVVSEAVPGGAFPLSGSAVPGGAPPDSREYQQYTLEQHRQPAQDAQHGMSETQSLMKRLESDLAQAAQPVSYTTHTAHTCHTDYIIYARGRPESDHVRDRASWGEMQQPALRIRPLGITVV